MSVLTGHVQQHCWHYTVGKFCGYIENCFYTLIYMYAVVLPHPQHLCSLQQCVIIFCQSNKATMIIHIRTLVDLKKIATDSMILSQCLWCEVTFLSTFLSPYTEIAWWFLVWQTWDIFLRDLAQEWLIFITCKSFRFYFTLVVAINLVTCLSFLNIERLIEDIDAD